jgi:Ser/Thr protein kinase RdoA (MazF antagonist)
LDSHAHQVPEDVLADYGFESAVITPIAIGLINQTFRVTRRTDGLDYVLQRLHPIFAGEVNLDIEAITTHLAEAGLITPRLVRTLGGDAWATADGAVYRVLTWVEGRTLEKLSEPKNAHAAAGLIARFHRALDGLSHRFHFTRPGAHDMQQHLEALREALRVHATHPNITRVRPVADRILAHAESLVALPATLPRRIIHGDLKISNVLFSHDLEEAIALVDLDTLAEGIVAIEMGDALRSWCNPAGEERPGVVDEAIFEAAMTGYAESAAGLLSPDEVASLVPGFETIALELAARFCADALNERYFGWAPERFPTRSEHNRVRALSQLGLAEAVEARRSALEDTTRKAFR